MNIVEAQKLLDISAFTDVNELLKAGEWKIFLAIKTADVNMIRLTLEAMAVMLRHDGRISEAEVQAITQRADRAVTEMTAQIDQYAAEYAEKVKRELESNPEYIRIQKRLAQLDVKAKRLDKIEAMIPGHDFLDFLYVVFALQYYDLERWVKNLPFFRIK